MRHKKSIRKLNRKPNHRKAMFINMANSLINYETIKTTIQKAKELRKFIEPLITISKINTISNKRFIFSKIRNKKNISKLFNDLGPHFLKRPGGYTRILKCGFRTGDNALMAYISFVDRKIKKINNIKKN